MFGDLQINIDGGLTLPLPRMAKVRQRFDSRALADVGVAVLEQLSLPEIDATIRPGASIAIGVGSRGVANTETAVKALVEGLRTRGAEPFIFPAMGSHGGATAEGQTALLARYGVTEERVGAPVRASMDTVVVAEMDDGTPLHMDRLAHQADGVVLLNRVKPHTNFRGDIESGLAKMVVIGMGKIAGATVMHRDHGMERFAAVLPPAAERIIERVPLLFGLALVEDAYDDTAIVEAVPPAQLIARETALQAAAKSMMAKLYFDDIDVLVIDQMGKEISGSGCDPNITGRNNREVEYWPPTPRVRKIVVLDLSEPTHGNATGIGLADVITQRLFERIDFATTYANVITSAYLDGGAIPVVMPTQRDAVALALKTCSRVKPENARVVRIRDTLHLGEIEVSESLTDEVRRHESMDIVSEAQAFRLDD